MNFIKKPNGEKNLAITANTRFEIGECFCRRYIECELESRRSKVCPEGYTEISFISFTDSIPESVKKRVEENEPLVGNPEEYVIDFSSEILVYANSGVGFLRALSTIMQLSDRGELTDGFIYDYPSVPERGYRVYLPGRGTFNEFKKVIDLLVYYKLNSIILEIGGGMEYKRHPKINEKWVEFCREVSVYSGRSTEIQESQHWKKNSIHYENADGSYLTQDECRMLKEYCDERGIEIIPECPTLSHSDYICLAYPELAERSNDPYPDTYCPSNPDTYKVVFDILDEVIEVFKPKRMNIGHDEFYSVALCERCRGKDPSTVYAEDVKVLSEYLASRNIGTMMWGEKLLKARYNYNGFKIGGWYDETNHNGVMFKVPDMFNCADKLPKGVTYLHWYWSFGEHLDDEFHARSYPVVFGNFSAERCVNFRTRINRGVRGGFVSNWGSFETEYMQRNRQYFALVFSSYALWSREYDTPNRDELIDFTMRELYGLHNQGVKNPIKVRHNVNISMPCTSFLCGVFIEDEKYILGHYKITYKDGTVSNLPVKYGTNIGSRDTEYATSSLYELSYSTLPIATGDGYVFEHLYENPNPDGVIEKIDYVPCAGKEDALVSYSFDFD